MELNIAERVNLISMYKSWLVNTKTDFDFTSMKVMNDFASNIGFTQDEIDKLQKSKDKFIEVKVVDRVKEVINKELENYDRVKQLNFLKHFSLCEKFGYQPGKKELELVKSKGIEL